ncbi:hypothetical protein V1509DRAFT_224276 [Lipomyces kononenkoae]
MSFRPLHLLTNSSLQFVVVESILFDEGPAFFLLQFLLSATPPGCRPHQSPRRLLLSRPRSPTQTYLLRPNRPSLTTISLKTSRLFSFRSSPTILSRLRRLLLGRPTGPAVHRHSGQYQHFLCLASPSSLSPAARYRFSATFAPPRLLPYRARKAGSYNEEARDLGSMNSSGLGAMAKPDLGSLLLRFQKSRLVCCDYISRLAPARHRY